MPMLIAEAFISSTNIPFVWSCSDCAVVFSLERLTRTPSITSLQKVNSNFEVHCRHVHPKSAVIGLEIPPTKEDASQAAARVVREATENK
jgi:Zn-finger protein